MHLRMSRRVHKGKNNLVLWITITTRSGGTRLKGSDKMVWQFDNVGLYKVSIKLDYKQVVDNITRRLNTNFKFDAIIDIWKTSVRTYQNFKKSFIRRQENNIGHLLAMTSLFYASSHILDNIPSCIETLVINEINQVCNGKKNISTIKRAERWTRE